MNNFFLLLLILKYGLVSSQTFNERVFYSNDNSTFASISTVGDFESFFNIKAIGIDSIVFGKVITYLYSPDTSEYIGIIHPSLPNDTIVRYNTFAKLFNLSKSIGTGLEKVNYILNHPDLRDGEKKHIIELLSKYKRTSSNIKMFYVDGYRYITINLDYGGYFVLRSLNIWLSSYSLPERDN